MQILSSQKDIEMQIGYDAFQFNTISNLNALHSLLFTHALLTTKCIPNISFDVVPSILTVILLCQ